MPSDYEPTHAVDRLEPAYDDAIKAVLRADIERTVERIRDNTREPPGRIRKAMR